MSDGLVRIILLVLVAVTSVDSLVASRRRALFASPVTSRQRSGDVVREHSFQVRWNDGPKRRGSPAWRLRAIRDLAEQDSAVQIMSRDEGEVNGESEGDGEGEVGTIVGGSGGAQLQSHRPAESRRRVETPSSAIRGLYRAFNDRNATAAANYLDDDCVYEDLLLGPNTICRGKEAFASALKFHPAFVTSSLFSQLPISLPALRLVVDSVAEGADCVGVEWHVEVGSSPFPLGRGLSQAKIDPETGKILRVVDIAEAPWRIIGIALTPLVSVALVLSEFYLFKR